MSSNWLCNRLTHIMKTVRCTSSLVICIPKKSHFRSSSVAMLTFVWKMLQQSMPCVPRRRWSLVWEYGPEGPNDVPKGRGIRVSPYPPKQPHSMVTSLFLFMLLSLGNCSSLLIKTLYASSPVMSSLVSLLLFFLHTEQAHTFILINSLGDKFCFWQRRRYCMC